MQRSSLPYFDQILQRLQAGDQQLERSFGLHVHWGFWPNPAVSAEVAREGFSAAAEALTSLMLEQAQLSDGQSILDVGCGFGGTLASLNRQWDRLALTGLNLDKRQIERARRNVQARPGNTLDWVVADACAMPLAPSSQDVVLAVECVFHFPSRDSFFQEVQRVLRPGGRLVLSDFVPRAPLALGLRTLQKLRRAPFSNATYGPVDSCWDRRRYGLRARQHGLDLCCDLDITPNTLPTYAVVRDLFEAMGAPQGARDTARVEQLCRAGLLQYRILTFLKPERVRSSTTASLPETRCLP